MHRYKSGSDYRYWKDDDGVWYGAVVVLHEDLPSAHRRYVLEGAHLDVEIPNARGLVRLWPLQVTEARGLGHGVEVDGMTVFEDYELTIKFGKR